MNDINFINTATPEQQSALKQWYRITLTFGILFLTVCGGITGWQLYRYSLAYSDSLTQKQKAMPFKKLLDQKAQLQTTIDEQTKTVEKFKELPRKTTLIHSFLQSISKIINPQELRSVRLGTETELNFLAKDYKSAQSICENLKKETGRHNLHIVSLESIQSSENKILLVQLKESKKQT